MKILYFTKDFSDKNIAFAKENGFVMRDVRAFVEHDFVEQCDFVTGDVPQAYLDKFPLFKQKVKAVDDLKDDDLKDLSKLTVPQLKELATQQGVQFDEHIKKADLIALLEQPQEEQSQEEQPQETE